MSGSGHPPGDATHPPGDATHPPGDATPAARKAALRARLLAARRALPAAVRAADAGRVREALLASLPGVLPGDPATVAGYAPFSAEPGGPELPGALAAALGPDGRVLLPALRPDGGLDWAAYRAGDPLVAGRRGIPEPARRRLGPAAVREAALVVVPALAVDRTGVRLGRGGGGYDRALAHVPAGIPVVALLHDGELLPAGEVPAEAHDRPVTAAITPTGGLVWLSLR